MDVTVVTDKPSHLPDGTPAREIELHYSINGIPKNWLCLATKKGDDVIVHVEVASLSGKVGDDLRAIPYSLHFQPEKDVVIKVPPDVQEFFDKANNDLVSHDLAKVMTHYSDRYLNSGKKKREIERKWGFMIDRFTTSEIGVTEFVPEGDKAYLAGFERINLGTGMLTVMLGRSQLSKRTASGNGTATRGTLSHDHAETHPWTRPQCRNYAKGAPMKRLIVLSIIMAIIVLVAALVHAQGPANDLKPTFISPTPGLYVNGWPAFTVSYPKEWVEQPPVPRNCFYPPGHPDPDLPPSPVLQIDVFPNPLPLEDWAKIFMPVWVAVLARTSRSSPTNPPS